MKVHDIILEGIIPFVPRSTILADLSKIKQLAGKTLTPTQWTHEIAKSVRIPGVKIQHVVSNQLDSGDMTVDAEYDEEQHSDSKSHYIYVSLVFSPKYTEYSNKELFLRSIGVGGYFCVQVHLEPEKLMTSWLITKTFITKVAVA